MNSKDLPIEDSNLRDAWWSSFPEYNPNPILEVSLKGVVLYMNQAARELLPTLEQEQASHPFLMGWETLVEQLTSQPELNILREISLEGKYFHQSIFYVKEYQSIRVYCLDITERRGLVSELENAKEILENQSQELEIQNEELQAQAEELLIQTEQIQLSNKILQEEDHLSKALIYINEIIHSAMDFDEMMQQALPEAARALRCDTAAISLFKDGQWTIRYVHRLDPSTIGLKMNNEEERHAVLAIRTKKPVAVEDCFEDRRVNNAHLKKWGIRSVLVVPIIVHSEAVGVIFFNYQKEIFLFQEMHLDFGKQLAAAISLALQNAQLVERLEAELAIQKQAEAELRLYNQELVTAHMETENIVRRLEAVLEALPVGVVITDEKGGIVQVNAAYEEVWGGKPPQTQSVSDYGAYRGWWVETGKEVAPEEWASAQAVQKARTVVGQMLVIRRFDGKKGYVINNASPVWDAEGKIAGSAVAVLDITRLHETEQALTEANERLQLQSDQQRERLYMLDRAHILVRDMQDRITYWNQGAEDLYQFSQEEAIDKNCHQLMRTKFPVPLEEIRDSMLRNEEWEGTLVHLKKDGEEVSVASHWALYRDEEGYPAAVVEVNNDISAQKKLELELEESNAYLEQRVNARTQELRVANEELIASNKELKEIMEELETAEEELRVQNEELVGYSKRLSVLADISQRLIEAGPDYQQVLDPVIQKISEQTGDTCILRLLNDSGQWLDPVAFYDPDPEARAVLKKSLQPKLHRSTDHLAGEVFKSGEGKIFRVQMPVEWEGRACEDMKAYISKYHTVDAAIAPLRLKNKVIGSLGLARHGQGNPYNQEDLLFLQELADRIAEAVFNARLYQDLEKSFVTEKMMRSQLIQSEKFAALARLVASVAHEINNPLQTVQNCLYLLEQDISGEVPRETITMAVSEAKRMSSLVEELRETYRPAKETQPKDFDLLALLENVNRLITPMLRQNSITWKLETEMNRAILHGIPDQIKQVIINIASNAVDAMGSKGGALIITVGKAEDEGKIWIAFQDTGPGIQQKYLTQIFEPFYTTKEKGTGLGLAISYEIVKNHGGEITAENEPGSGARFTVRLPVEGRK